jgi:hypothetical protein
MVQPVLLPVLPVLRTCVNGRLLQLPKMNRCFGSRWTACPSSHSIRRTPRWRSIATTCAASPSTKHQLYVWATNSGYSSSISQGLDANETLLAEPTEIVDWRSTLLNSSSSSDGVDNTWSNVVLSLETITLVNSVWAIPRWSLRSPNLPANESETAALRDTVDDCCGSLFFYE